jgi:hypothetical protein
MREVMMRSETRTVGTGKDTRVDAHFSELVGPAGQPMPDLHLSVSTSPRTGAIDRVVSLHLEARSDAVVTAETLRDFADALGDFVSMAVAGMSYSRTSQAVAGTGREGSEVARAAEIYRAAVLDGDPPIRRIVDEMNLSTATAARRVRKAKDLGLIPERADMLTRTDDGRAVEMWQE